MYWDDHTFTFFYSSSRTLGGPNSRFRQFVEKEKSPALAGSYRVALQPCGSKHVKGRQMCGHEHDTVAGAGPLQWQQQPRRLIAMF
jgi:hypothetical protein